jgi:hypothetical protein
VHDEAGLGEGRPADQGAERFHEKWMEAERLGTFTSVYDSLPKW